MGTAWLAPVSSVVLVVVNLSDQARAVEIRPPWQRAAEASLAPSEAITGNEPSVVKLTIPARDGRIVRVKTRESNQ